MELVVDDLVGPVRREYGRDGQDDRAEGQRRHLQEPETASAVGMSGHQPQIKVRDAPGDGRHDEQPPDPMEQEKGEYRAHHQQKPPSSNAQPSEAGLTAPSPCKLVLM